MSEYGNYGRRPLGQESRGGASAGGGVGDSGFSPSGPNRGAPPGGPMDSAAGPFMPQGQSMIAPHGNMYQNPKLGLGGYRGVSGAPPGSPNTYSAAGNMASAGANEPIGNPGGNPSGGYPGVTPNPGFYGQPPRPQGVPLNYVFTPGPSGGRPEDYWVPAPGMSPGSGNY